MKKITTIWSVGLGLALAAVSNVSAATSGPYTATVSTQSTNWNYNFELPKFDASLGTLQAVTFTLSGQVSGSAQGENLSGSDATITYDLQAQEKLTRPDGSALVVILPLASGQFNATAFDGLPDYAGTSGFTVSGLNGSANDAFTTTSAADLLLFTATAPGQTITLPMLATGQSAGSGAGGLTTIFHTNAGAVATVTYTYAPVPEPASLGVLTVAGGFFLLRRGRKFTAG